MPRMIGSTNEKGAWFEVFILVLSRILASVPKVYSDFRSDTSSTWGLNRMQGSPTVTDERCSWFGAS